MAIFVHNEPTCLSVIQEAKLPETFYGIIESGLEPVIDVGIPMNADHRTRRSFSFVL